MPRSGSEARATSPPPRSAANARSGAATRAVALAPALFVLLWSTGFVGARYGLPYAEPFTFLALRLALAAALLGVAALVTGGRLSRAQAGHAAVSGLLLHATYLGGVFWAISRGTPAGVSSVVVSLQPVLVAALAAPLLGERLVRRQWLGLALGVVGVGLVLAPGLRAAGAGGLPPAGVVACLLALAGGTAGTLWQKQHGDATALLPGTCVQYAAAAAVLGLLALLAGPGTVRWTGPFVLAMAWLVLVLSIGAVLLLLWLLRHGSASGVSSLFYLVPPATAVEAYVAFGERLAPLSVLGIGVTAVGVALAVRG